MDRARILNLIETMEARIDRMERVFAPNAATTSSAILQSLGTLKARAARSRSKIDTLKAVDISPLRALIEEIRNHSSAPELSFRALHAEYQNRSGREALLDDTDYLLRLVNGMLIGIQLTESDVRELLPGQKPAAVRFAFDNDNQKIIIANEPFRPAAKEADMAAAALEEIISQGVEVNEDLQQTNAAPRLKSAFARLQDRLVSHQNIVQVGQTNLHASRMLTSYVEELSNSQFQQLRAHLEGVAQVLNQFPDWRIFCENAVGSALDDAAMSELTASAAAMAEQLRISRNAAAEVSDAIDEVITWVGEGEKPDKRDALSLARMMENLWSFLTKHALAQAVKDEATKMVARAIIVALVGAVGFGFAPILSKVPGAAWIEPTAAYLKAHLPSFAPK